MARTPILTFAIPRDTIVGEMVVEAADEGWTYLGWFQESACSIKCDTEEELKDFSKTYGDGKAVLNVHVLDDIRKPGDWAPKDVPSSVDACIIAMARKKALGGREAAALPIDEEGHRVICVDAGDITGPSLFKRAGL